MRVEPENKRGDWKVEAAKELGVSLRTVQRWVEGTRPSQADVIELPPKVGVAAAARYVGLSMSFMNRARLRGDGPVFLKLGRRVVYDRADLDEWLNSRKRHSTSGE